MRTLLLSALCLASSVAAGCDDSNSDAPPDAAAASLCTQIVTQVCQAACDCDPAVACVTAYGTALTVRYDDPAHCETFERYLCEREQVLESQQQGCLQSLGSAQCKAVTHDGAMYEALTIPPECIDVL